MHATDITSQIPSHRRTVQACPGVAVFWGDVPSLSSSAGTWPCSWQQVWQQSSGRSRIRSGTDVARQDPWPSQPGITRGRAIPRANRDRRQATASHAEPVFRLAMCPVSPAGRHPAMPGMWLGVKGSPVQIRPSRLVFRTLVPRIGDENRPHGNDHGGAAGRRVPHPRSSGALTPG
jgi:hypothetical protein